MAVENIPEKVRPFVTLGFDYDARRQTGRDAFGDCPFCAKHNKFYLNVDTGQWKCMAGHCARQGNTSSFIGQWHEVWMEDQDDPTCRSAWDALSNERLLEVSILKEAGIVYDGDRFAIPVCNRDGTIVNLRLYKLGQKLRGLPAVDTALFGAELLSIDERSDEVVYVCEGEWDALALRFLLSEEGQPGIVVGTPGASVFKTLWVEYLMGRDIVICYDHDVDGAKGTQRVYNAMRLKSPMVKSIYWPPELPDKFDIRDFVTRDGTYTELCEMVEPYISDKERHEEKTSDAAPRVPLSRGLRPTLDKTLQVFRDHLKMTKDLEDALKVIYSVVYSQQIPGDPVWMHIVSPAGSGKTELLQSLSSSPSCYWASVLTPHSLVSGMQTGDTDPSILPDLFGRTFVLKDFTEVLAMQSNDKDAVYSVLRGAYDGEVFKPFGNGVKRTYKGTFSMLSGVTNAVYGDRKTALGERFLHFHILRGLDRAHNDAVVDSAIRSVGKEAKMRPELAEASRAFVETEISLDDIPEIPDNYVPRIRALANIVAHLRASVEREYRGGESRMRYRPQPELGTRLAKQLAKLLLGLALCNTPVEVTEDDYRLVVKTALDTCNGFHLEAVDLLMDGNEGSKVSEISAMCNMADSTMGDSILDLVTLGCLVKRPMPSENTGVGRSPMGVFVTDFMRHLWQESGLEEMDYFGVRKRGKGEPVKVAGGRIRVRKAKATY